MAGREEERRRFRDSVDLLRALPAVLGVRLLLRLLPYASWRRLFARALEGAVTRNPVVRNDVRPERIARAVSRAARVVPGASCLTQALAAQLLLARAGHFARLRLGVARDARGVVHAHAWLETSQGTLDVSAVGGAFAPLTTSDDSKPAHRAASPHRRAAGEP